MYEVLNVLLPYKDDSSLVPSDVVEILDILAVSMSQYQRKQFEYLLDVWKRYGWNNKGRPMLNRLYFRCNPFQHDSEYIKGKLVCKMHCEFCKLSGAESSCTEYLKRNKKFVLKRMKVLKKNASPSEKKKAIVIKRFKHEMKIQALVKCKKGIQDVKKKTQTKVVTPRVKNPLTFHTSSFYPKSKSLRAMKDSKKKKIMKDVNVLPLIRRKLSFSGSSGEESTPGDLFPPIKAVDNPFVDDDVLVASSDYQSGDSDMEEEKDEDQEEQDYEEKDEEPSEEELSEEELSEEEQSEEEPMKELLPVKCSRAFIRNRRHRLNAFSN